MDHLVKDLKDVIRDGRSEVHDLLRKKKQKTPWQPIPILLGAGIPTLLFAWVYFCCCSGLRFYNPVVAVLLGPVLGLLICIALSFQSWSLLRKVQPARTACTLAIAVWVAFGLSALGGDLNYWWHLVSFYDFQDLATYTDIDPTHDMGQSYMDAGQIYFREFSQVLTDQMVAYRSQHVFCVAPIMLSPVSNQHGEENVEQNGAARIPKSATVDFWAVGIDCCDQETREFTCGAVGEKKARAGIRLLRDDVRPFYNLAVQEWTARWCPLDENTLTGLSQVSPLMCPEARHPLFFHWVVDPLLEVDNYYEKSSKLFHDQVVYFAIGNFFLVLALSWLLFALGVR